MLWLPLQVKAAKRRAIVQRDPSVRSEYLNEFHSVVFERDAPCVDVAPVAKSHRA
jgi:hypothetical protein